MVQAGWWTRNSVGSGLVSVELREWLRRVEEARGIPGRSAGMWLERWMALWTGDSAKRVWLKGQDVRQLQVYVVAAGVRVREARG
jgi:hypothetical protein